MVVSTFEGITSFSPFVSAFSLPTFRGNAIQSYSGPGRLYTDQTGRGFFTTDTSLVNTITTFLNNLPPVPPRIVSNIVGGMEVVNIQTSGGQRLVEISSATSQPVTGNQGVYYFGNQVYTANVFRVPDDSRAFYDVTNGRVMVFNPNSGEVIFTANAPSFSEYLVPGGPVNTVNVNTTFPFNGYVYTGPTGGLYTINNDINSGIDFTVRTIGAIVPEASPSNIVDFSYYNGQRTQRFSGSAPAIFPGGGIFYTSGNQTFYTTDGGFILNIPTFVSRLIPIMSSYNQTTGQLVVTNSRGEIIFMYTVGVSPSFEVGSRQSFRFVDNSIIGLTREPITGVNELRYYNGIELITFTDGNFTFMGPGFFGFNEETGVAFFTDDANSARIILQRERNARSIFRAPVIGDPSPQEIISKFRQIDALFGQRVTVYEGADVNLRCEAVAFPPAEFDFFFLDDMGNRVRINETDDTDNFEIVMGTNYAELRITDIVMDTRPDVFVCMASNIRGSFSQESVVEVRPTEPPAIVNNFFPFDPVREEYGIDAGRIVTAQSPFVTIDDVILSRPVDASELIPNPALITNVLHIGCKGEGRPKADIAWFLNGNRINITDPAFDIIEPREGRSVLTVNYTILLARGDAMIGMETTFSCQATNGVGGVNMVEGGVIVNPTQYTCTPAPPDEPCPVSCGFGVQPQGAECTSVDADGNLVAEDFENIPNGLFQLGGVLCRGDILFCPFESFAFNDDEPFGDCSVTCGCGVQTREILCFQTIDGVIANRSQPVDDENCIQAGARRPDDILVCTLDDCPIWVINSSFSECSQTCRGGVRRRDVFCYQNISDSDSMDAEERMNANFTFTLVDDSQCDNLTMPDRERRCNQLIPCPFRWHVSNWRECIDNCQDRDVFCVNFESTQPLDFWPANVTDCEREGLTVPPHSVRSCGYGACDRGDWFTSSFGQCSVECGFGTWMRNVSCIQRGIPEMITIEDGNCNPRSRPASVETCIVRNCPGRCDFEPNHCRRLAQLKLCKVERFRPMAEPCCKSCPLQATPIPLLDRGVKKITTTAPPPMTPASTAPAPATTNGP